LPAAVAEGTATDNLNTTAFATQNYDNDIPLAIPDLNTLTSDLNLASRDAIGDVDVHLNLTHARDSDLVVRLTSPTGRSVLLVNRRGGTGDNFSGTILDDEASTSIALGTAPFTGRYRPEQALSRFDGYPADGVWTLSISDLAGGGTGTLLSWGLTVSLNSGAVHTYTWDLFQSGVMGQSDDAVFRIEAIPAITNTPNQVPGPYLYGSYAASTFPFRVRGSQVRVLSGTVPISNALVYRLPAGQTVGGRPYTNLSGEPFRTDGEGYLQGRGEIQPGDRLLAMASITSTESYRLYYTSASPTETGLDAFSVTQSGVQTLTVSADNPLIVFDLQVALEWDAHNDPTYLQQLEFDLRKASEYLYDFTNGQVALGRVTVFQNAEAWAYSHVVVQSTNRMRPFAMQGGIVITPTVDPEHSGIIYPVGQVRMGATWNRYGEPGQNLGEDWPLALAHELAHYLLFLDDTYLGLNEEDLLIPVDTCVGSAMGDMYAPSKINTEFLSAGEWLTPPPRCANTLANKTLDRSEWETIQLWYPWLKVSSNPGPSLMPFELTTVTVHDPLTPTNTLEDPTFYLDYQGGGVSSSEARAFLIEEGQYVFDLGSPMGGQNRVLARGARPGDRLCVFDGPRHQYGCEIVESGDERLSLEQDENWLPLIQLSPVTSQTLTLEVKGVPGGLPVRARLYPEYGPGSEVISLVEAGESYIGTFVLPYPALAGQVQVWVEEPDSETNPRRETIAGYGIGGNLGSGPADRGSGPADRGSGPADRGSGPADRGSGPSVRGRGAPLVSPDGQMIFFALDPDVFHAGDLYTVHNMTSLPPLPVGKKAVGPGYNLVASPGALGVITGSISFQYLGIDALTEGVEETELTIHFWNGKGWRALETVRDPYYNLASSASQGPGVYALLGGVTIPHIERVIPSAATNDVTTTLVISGSYFLEPVKVELIGSHSTYIPHIQSVSSDSITALIAPALAAGEYQVRIVNGDGGVSPQPGTFALYDPADACFYDFFESGSGKWEGDGDWEIGILPGGERAITDSPAGNYDNAIPPAITHTTAITSQSFEVKDCPNPALTFRHDYAIARVGDSRDVGRVEISADGGITWQELASYSGGGVFGEGVTVQDIPSPEWTDVAWKDVAIDLSAYTGTLRLRFSLQVDRNISDKGWVIDDVMVKSGSGTNPSDYNLFLPIILRGG
jgi:subtilisin-like proprotein convertase family protein